LGLSLLGGGPGIGGAPAQEQEGDDNEMRALLLRQKYLAAIELGEDQTALRAAEQMIELGTLGDIARQDAARAALGIDEIDAAIGHLRIAARVSPPDRRAFHYAHLGSLLRFDGQTEEAIHAFTKASRWATEDRDLYQAQQALAEAAQGRTEKDLEDLRSRLEDHDPMKAYSLWILGELCLVLGDTESGATYLKRFLSRQDQVPRAKSLALKGEVAHASELLRQISA
jgi:tetratricopeptide (TPR) repeat protein